MNRIQKSLLGAGLVSALILSSTASWAEMHGEGHGQGDRAGRYEQHMQERADALQSALQLSSAQQAAWQQFQTAMKPAGRPGMQEREAHRESFKRMDTLQRLDWMKDKKTMRDAQMGQRDEAIRSFYGQLSAEQKKTFDAQFWMRAGHDKDRAHGESRNDRPEQGGRPHQ